MFLRNAWYPVGWAEAMGDQMIARRIVDTPIVILPSEGGGFSALEDRCPHRLAPLSLGRISPTTVECGYHGLVFDHGGRCVHNPHGTASNALTVRSYPLVEKQGMLWIWMGDPVRVDTTPVPDFPVLEEEGVTWVRGELEVSAHYELIIDNLLDLTHVEFLHPFIGTPGFAAHMRFRTEQAGDRITAYYDIPGQPITALFRLLWDGDDERGDMRSYMYWHAPSQLYLDTRMAGCGASFDDAVSFPTMHLLCPESDDSTRYFWAAGRNRRLDDAALSMMGSVAKIGGSQR